VSDIFNEVDEEVRREQLKKLWERYGNLIIAAAVMVVLAVAAWRGYDYWQARQAAVAGSAFDAATVLADQGKHDEAEAAFTKLAADGTAGYRLLARLRSAEELGEHDPKAAVTAYDAIAADNASQPLLGNLASIRAALLLVDTASFDEMTRRLEPLAQPMGGRSEERPGSAQRVAGAHGRAHHAPPRDRQVIRARSCAASTGSPAP